MNKYLIILLIIALTACAPVVPLQRDQTATFSKGTTLPDVANSLGKATITLAHEFDVNGRHFLANHYDLQTGTTQQMTVMCTPTCVAYPITVPVTAPYVMIYEGHDKVLIAWGTVEELSRSPDESISSIMPELKASYDYNLSKKKK